MSEKIKAVSPPEPKATEQPSTGAALGFPSFDFDSSLGVAQAIYTQGGGACDLDQLAAWLKYTSINSGTFASRLAAARYFGLIGNTRAGRIAISDRGRVILAPVMPDDAVNGRAEAFLSVDLYKKVFDKYRGMQLPPDVGLANLFQQEFRVSPDRLQAAVRIFKDSAKQTGFFQSASDRLIRPSGSTPATAAAPTEQRAVESQREEPRPSERRRGGGGGDDGGGVDPSILGLLRQLPQPGAGWTTSDQKAFLEAFTAVVKFIYPAKADLTNMQ